MRYTHTKRLKLIFILLAFVFTVSVYLSGCNGQSNTVPTDRRTGTEDPLVSVTHPVNNRSLSISLSADPEVSSITSFDCEELGGNFTEGLTYWYVTNVSIDIDGKSMKLESALQEGLITENDILYYARLDAANGVCQETYESTHGLTNFTYYYPEYALRIIYDTLETPDGQQRLISDMSVYPPGFDKSAYYVFFDSETSARYDVEDWGIAFQVASASPAGISIICTQSEGQQIGNLSIISYALHNAYDIVARTDSDTNEDPRCDDGNIQMNGTTIINIDWSEYYGELPSGNYTLELYVKDEFSEDQIHPLMVDYYDLWCYEIEFYVP